MNNAVLNQYDKQKSRGQQGFGVFDGSKLNMIRASKEDKILKWLCKYDSDILLMHHRFPTSTINVKRAAHPFSTKGYFGDTQYVLVHNGSIRNADELFCDHQELGIKYHSLLQDLTFNDSEALLWDFALYMEGKQDNLKAGGGIAFICLKLVKGKLERMYFGRNTSPLNLLRSDLGISLSSEGKGEAITPHVLYNWNYKLRRLTKKDLVIPSGYVTGQYTSGNWNSWDNSPSSNYQSYRYGYDYMCQDCEEFSYACERHFKWPDEPKKEPEQLGNVLARQFASRLTTPLIPREKAIDRLIDPVTNAEVTQEYLAYLASTKGRFEDAYWSIEADYNIVMDLPDTRDNLRERRLMEMVLEKINNDPDYKDENSVSSVWDIVWRA